MLKLSVKQVIYQSRYNDNIKRPKPQDTQLGILKIYTSCRKIQKRVSGPGQRYWRYVVYIFENTPKNLVVQGRAQLEHSSHIVKVGVEATCFHFNPRRILSETTERRVYLELYHRNPGILERVLNWVTLANSTAEKCAPMQVMKQPEHGRTSTSEEQKWPSFQANYD